jgi:hypothetical protein
LRFGSFLGISQHLIGIAGNIAGNILQTTIQDTAQIIQRGGIHRFIFPQFINRSTGNMIFID